MKSIQEVMRAKELEVLKAIEDALQERDAELRQVQKNLMETLRVVNRLLETDSSAIEAAVADATSSMPAKRPAPQTATAAASGSSNPPLAWEQPAKRFP